MKLMKNSYTYLAIFLILFACCTQETEALRRVLRGRRTLTRSYFEGLAIPGWALVLVIALSELLLGGILYAVMYKFIIAKDTDATTNTYAPASTGYAPASAQPYAPSTNVPYNAPPANNTPQTPPQQVGTYTPTATTYTPPAVTTATSHEV